MGISSQWWNHHGILPSESTDLKHDHCVNSEAESWTGIGVVAGFAGAAGMMNWPHLKIAKIIV
jgi:hypothetical protein